MSTPVHSFDLHLSHSHSALQQLPEPKQVFKHLLMCLETPRPSNLPNSRKELELITQKLLDFGKAYGLDCAVDSAGNVRLRLQASPGYEKATRIVMQSHMDMVCSAASDKVHNFYTDPVTPIIEGNLLRADRTTLGADDGIGVAASLAILEEAVSNTDPSFIHGQLEALITVDEETTMGGAENIDGPPFLESDVMLNLDSEEANSICVGCAGGAEKKMFLPLQRTALKLSATPSLQRVRLSLHSLLGGHTGIDIDKGRANALILLARLLNAALAEGVDVQLCSLKGGNAPNAIPRDATCDVLVPSEAVQKFQQVVDQTFARMQKEFAMIERKVVSSEENAAGQQEEKYAPCMVLGSTQPQAAANSNQEEEEVFAASVSETQRMVALMLNLPHGPLKVNIALSHAVDTSISFSLAQLLPTPQAASSTPGECEEDALMVHLFTRSSFDEDVKDVDAKLEALAMLAGCKYTPAFCKFPGWDPKLDSAALKQVISTHQSLFQKAARVYSVHAGLECGLFKLAYPDLDCVSIGPTIHHAHSPQECLLIDTVEPFYKWLKQSIVNITKDSVNKQ